MKQTRNEYFRFLSPSYVNKGFFLCAFLFIITAVVYTQDNIPTSGKVEFTVNQICATPWGDEPSGLPYLQTPGLNVGVTSFIQISKTEVAYLANASNEIIKVNCLTGEIISRMKTIEYPIDFIYENSTYYVLTDTSIFTYDYLGNYLSQVHFSTSYIPIKMSRSNGYTYLLLADGSSVAVEHKGKSANQMVFSGWISSDGTATSVSINPQTGYSVSMQKGSKQVASGTFSTDKRVGSIINIGSKDDVIYLELQLVLSESPVKADRWLVALKKEGDALVLISSLHIPDIKYVYSVRNFIISENGILQLITSPEGALLFDVSLTDNINEVKDYPENILSTHYHYRDHTLDGN